MKQNKLIAILLKIVKKVLRGVAVGYSIRAIMHLVSTLLKNRSKTFHVLAANGGKKWLQIHEEAFPQAKFLGLYNLIYHSVVEILDHMGGTKKPMHAGMAGAMAGVALLVEKRDRWFLLPTYLFCRALYRVFSFHPQIMDILLFCIVTMIIMFAYVHDPQLIERPLLRMYTFFWADDKTTELAFQKYGQANAMAYQWATPNTKHVPLDPPHQERLALPSSLHHHAFSINDT